MYRSGSRVHKNAWQGNKQWNYFKSLLANINTSLFFPQGLRVVEKWRKKAFESFLKRISCSSDQFHRNWNSSHVVDYSIPAAIETDTWHLCDVNCNRKSQTSTEFECWQPKSWSSAFSFPYLVHRVTIGESADVLQLCTGRQLVAYLIHDKMCKVLHSLWSTAHANKLKRKEI